MFPFRSASVCGRLLVVGSTRSTDNRCDWRANVERLLISIPDAAVVLGLGRSKIYELMAQGRLESVSIGRRRLIRAGSIRALALGQAA
jgi:excisionase family DNA binding protein